MDFTPLNLAASNNNHSFDTAMFEAAANPGAREINDKTPWDYAQGDEARKNTGPKKHFSDFRLNSPTDWS